MPPYKRSRVSTSRAAATAVRVGNWKSVAAAGRARRNSRAVRNALGIKGYNGLMLSRVSRLESMIETKEGQWTSANNIGIEHNNVKTITKDDTGVLNPFQSVQGTGDPMNKDGMARVGDKVSIKGMLVKGMVEGALSRSRVYFRIMLIRAAKGDTINRSTLFKGKSDNKMLDQINTERFTVVWQRIFNVSPPNSAPTAVDLAGVPTGTVPGTTGSRIFKAWIPGRKFGRNGTIQYEDGSATQVKFYDYRFVVLAYDWYGTPQDVNTVGRVNEMYSVLYYKDA